MRTDAPSKQYSPAEEIFNSVSHGIGALISVPAALLLILNAANHHNRLGIACFVVYGITLFGLYLSSTLYHGVNGSPAKQFYRTVDCSAIYLLIAGSYTPVTLLALPGVWRWSIFIAVWLLALIGIVLNWLTIQPIKRISYGLYFLMGWLVIIAAKPMLAALPAGLLLLIGAGGLFYTTGVIFYAARRIPYNHGIWHLFVLAGSLCHYLGYYYYLT
jgi:hemolysin III